jgi:P27 family predicted phage terminase small subunit
MRGPPPVPTNLRLLRGNPSKRPIRPEPQPTIPDAVPSAPEWISGYAREEWERVAGELYRLRLLTVVDIAPFAAYCVAYQNWRTAYEKFKEMQDRDPVMAGFVVKSGKGTAISNPIFLALRQAGTDMVRFAGEFGMAPAARARIANAGFDPPRGPGKFDGLLA